MATFGQGINASLGRIDYSPFLQGASQGAQMRAQGMQQLGAGISQGIQQYQANKKLALDAQNEFEEVASVNPSVLEWLQSKQAPEAAQKAFVKMQKNGTLGLNDATTLSSAARGFLKSEQIKQIKAQQDFQNKLEEQRVKIERQKVDNDALAAMRAYFSNDSLKDDLTRAQIAKTEAETAAIGVPKPVDTFGDESGLRKELQTHQSFKNYDIVKNFFERGVSVAKDDTAASDIALIFSYMKVLDPTSVVREGEYATAENAAGVPTRIRNAYEKALSGERLQPEQRKQYIEAMRKAAKTQFEQIQPIVSQYKKIAEKRKLDPANILPDYYQSFNALDESDDDSIRSEFGLK